MDKNKKRKNTFLSFGIGKETFAVPVGKVLEVLEKQYITDVPNTPEYINGVINFRGNIIPVFETRKKFGLENRGNNQKYVIIVFDLFVKSKKMVIGAITDEVNDVLTFEENAVLPVPEMGLNYNADFLSGMIKNDESFTMILDIDKVFSEEEVRIINETTAENIKIATENESEVSS